MRAVAVVLAAVLLVSGVDAAVAAPSPTPAAAAAAAPAAPGTPPKTATEAQDATSALALARLSKQRIEIVAERSETATTWANPDGTFTTQMHAAPVRFRDGQGQWRDVDLALGAAASDGSVRPRGHARGLRLGGRSAASESEAVSVEEGPGRGVTLAWPGGLPAPEVSGAEAIYRDVQPGVDLRVQSRRSGFEQFLTLRSRPVGPVSWTLPVKTRGLSVRADADGGISFLDAKAVVVSRILPAQAWDAVVDPNSDEPVNTSPVALSVQAKGAGRALLTVTPDAAWLADPARVFPVTVDPTYASTTVNTSFDTFVQSGFVSDQSASTELRAGTYDGTTVARSYLNFPLQGALHGKKVISGSLSLYEVHSWSCSAREVRVYNAAPASTATRWTSQPTVWSLYGTLNVAKGYSTSCNDGWIDIPITSLLQYWSGVTAATGGILVRAASETDVYG